MRIHLAKLAAALALAIALPALAWAQAPGQSWPQRSIKMIVPFPAGGGTDFIARLAAKHLSERLRPPGVVWDPRGAHRATRPAGARRRQRRHRPAGADAIRSRRLHDLDLLRHPAGGQPIALREASLRAAAGLRPGSDHGAVSGDAGRAPVGAGAFGVGTDRAREVE